MGSVRVNRCDVCGVTWEKEPHDHRTAGTLSPEAAATYWRRKVSAERDAREAADAVPGQ